MMSGREKTVCLIAAGIGLVSIGASPVFGAGGAPDFDFDWATIGDPGNAGWHGEVSNLGTNRGAVDYTFRMSKTEISSAQWREFISTMRPIVGDPDFGDPAHWGYFEIFGEFVEVAPDAGNTPVYGITWRDAAMYCNWLHNGKQASIEAISNGAYDASTFGSIPDPRHGEIFTDQLTRNPDAQFWIPSLDEWIKAAHYDPNKNGDGEGGYWMYPTTSDTAPVPGSPGEGETSAGTFEWEVEGFENLDSRDIPLGSYPEITSPWGLLDVSGGSLEWTEETTNRVTRITMGANAGGGIDEFFFALDRIDTVSRRRPNRDFDTSFRIASAIPAPGTGILGVTAISLAFMGRKGASR